MHLGTPLPPGMLSGDRELLAIYIDSQHQVHLIVFSIGHIYLNWNAIRSLASIDIEYLNVDLNDRCKKCLDSSS